MTKSEKRRYESAVVEVLLIKAEDIIVTSGFGENTDYVDSDENAWVTIGQGGWN